MNGEIVDTNPIDVSFAQYKGQHRAQLEATEEQQSPIAESTGNGTVGLTLRRSDKRKPGHCTVFTRVNGEQRYLGTYDQAEEAARASAAKQRADNHNNEWLAVVEDETSAADLASRAPQGLNTEWEQILQTVSTLAVPDTQHAEIDLSQWRSRSKCGYYNDLGYLGVYRNGNRFQAALRYDGKLQLLGLYDTPEEAARAVAVKHTALYSTALVTKANTHRPKQCVTCRWFEDRSLLARNEHVVPWHCLRIRSNG